MEIILDIRLYIVYNRTTKRKGGADMPFYNEYSLQADERGRLRIPSAFRTAFGDTKLYAFKNKKGCYLRIFGTDILNAMVAGFEGKVPVEETPASRRIRRIYKNIIDIEEDKQGRFTIPQKLREQLKIVKDVVFIGMGNTIELWAKEVYDEFEAQLEAEDDENEEFSDEEFDDFKF